MAEDKRYSIISVSSDEDEDIVIQAGVVEPDAGAPAPSRPASEKADANRHDAPAPTSADAVTEVTVEEQAVQPEESAEDESMTEQERRRLRRARARAAELERLNETERQLSEKTEQSGMHKTVLALFAVGVVVCSVLYYVFFMA